MKNKTALLIPERLAELPNINLKTGAHLPNHTFCAMELAAWLANEPWSDHPTCVSPVLGAFIRSFNDGVDDETRQKLKPYIVRAVDTDGNAEADERRAWMATDWLVRVCAPAFLDLAHLKTEAQAMRDLSPLTKAPTDAEMKTIRAGKDKAAAAGPAAWAAAWAAARDAAGDAAWAAAWAAARDAARAAAGAAARAAAWAAAGDAAWDAAGAAAWDAAGAAAWDAARAAAGAAARDAARDAAGAALKPTVKKLQKSAFDLLDRMIGD